MAKSNANSGGATVLEEPAAGYFRPQADPEPRAPQPEAGEPFLRARRRVPVRRGLLPLWARTRWGRALFAGLVLAVLAAGTGAAVAARNFLERDARFRIASAASITTVGNSQLTRADLLTVFGSDIGRNLFLAPLGRRRAELEQLPWVEEATVMRVLPNQLRVWVKERTPVAFVEENGRIELADAAGVILTMSPQEMAAKHYSFPVVTGIDPGVPLSVRAARMALYERFLKDVDAGGEKVSSQLSEIDLSDPEDVRATAPSQGTDLLLYFGMEDFLARWRNYQAHVAEWRGQYPKLASVDLRYQDEVVLKMAGEPGSTDAGSAAPGTLTAQNGTAPAAPAPEKHATHTVRRKRHEAKSARRRRA